MSVPTPLKAAGVAVAPVQSAPVSPRRRAFRVLVAAALMVAGACMLVTAYFLNLWPEALFKVGMAGGLLLGMLGLMIMLIGGWLEGRALGRAGEDAR